MVAATSLFGLALPWDWLTFAFTGSLALGWSIINGVHRRNPSYKEKVCKSAALFPPMTRRKLLRLVAPTRLEDRVNHSLVIAGCCLIIAAPVLLIEAIIGWLPWWQIGLIAVLGSLFGALVGEFVFNSYGTALEMPTEPNPPQTTDEDGQ